MRQIYKSVQGLETTMLTIFLLFGPRKHQSFPFKLAQSQSIKSLNPLQGSKTVMRLALGIAASYRVARKARHRQRRWSALNAQNNLGD